MRPSSSPSEEPAPGLLSGLFGGVDVDAELTDPALLQAMLDVERALAEACADVGLVPREAAAAIGAVCTADRFDVPGLGRAAEGAGNPVVPLVHALTELVPPEARPWVHHGATSQDVLDSALVLVAVRATQPLLRDLDVCADRCAGLAAHHRGTVMVARTLGQQASPTTFGLKAAGWLVGLIGAGDRLARVRGGLPVQLGGAAGTLAAHGDAGVAVSARLAERLDLARPLLPWHTDRSPVLDLAAALGATLSATGKIALDVGLLAQTEVGEVSEGDGGVDGRGGSSSMPHKRNPVDSVLVTALARRAPGLVGTLYATSVQEHERAAGGWHAEWEPLLELLRLAGAAAARTRKMLEGLQVHPDRMRANLDATGGLVMAESVAARLAPHLGRSEAHDVVARAAAEHQGFRDALLASPEVREHLGAEGLDEALDPGSWLGAAVDLVDRALQAHRDRPAPTR
ncbi:MAG TPA: 3-carboxy-cis,cis-muconate cycloisomerase [Actinomycetes bacterium]